MFSLQAVPAFRTASPVTPACIAVVAVALLASLISDLSGISFLDEGQEEFIVLAILIPLSFIYAHCQKKIAPKQQKQKCIDAVDLPRTEKPKHHNKTKNAKVSETNPSCDDSREEYSSLSQKFESLAKSGDVMGAKALMSEAIESGLDSSRLAVCLGHLLRACAQAKDADAAKANFDSMQDAGVKVNVVHYGTLISVYAQTGDLVGAEACLQDCIEAGIEPNTVCYNTVLNACSRSGNMAKLREWFDRMEAARVARDQITFSTVIHGAIRAQDATYLDTWLKQMISEGISLPARSYEDALTMCAQASLSHLAEQLFQDMVKNRVAITGKIVHNVARARLYAGNCASCMEVIENGLKEDIDLLPATYITAAEASNKLGDSCACALWLSRAARALGDSTDSFAVIASIAVCAGQRDCAVNWMQKLHDHGSQEQISAGYVMVLKCCARLNDDVTACFIAKEATKKDVSLTAEGYSAIVKACCRASNREAAECWLSKMHQAGIAVDAAAFCNVIGLCTRLEDATRGEFWLNTMAASGPQNDACVRVFLDMCEKSASPAAKHSASRVIAKLEAANIHFTSGDNSLFLLKVLVRSGHIAKGEQVLQAFAGKFGKSVASQGYQTIINAYAQVGDFRSAEAWLMRMTRAGLTPDVIAYSTIIHACAKAGQPMRAEAVLAKMQEAQVEPNTICFNEIINAFAEAGDLQKAEEYFDSIQKRGLTPSTSTYNSILKACAKSGDASQAEEWFQKMVSSGLDVELDATTFGTLMNAWKDVDPTKTEQWLQQARCFGVKLNVVHYSTAIHAYAKIGAFAKAEALIDQALADGLQLNTMCYNNVISACAGASQPARAEGWLVKMRQAGIVPNSYTCFSIVNAWLKVSDFARAKSAMLAMEKDGLQPREEVFTAFAKMVARSGSRVDLDDCIAMANQRGCQDNEFFLHAHLSALVSMRAHPSEVEHVSCTAVDRGIKLNPYIRTVLNKGLGHYRAEALIKKCGGVVESSKPAGKRYEHSRRDRA